MGCYSSTILHSRPSKCSASFVLCPCFSACILPLWMPIATTTRKDLARSTLHRESRSTTSGVALGCVSHVAINSTSNTCTHYINRHMQLVAHTVCQKWLLLCMCLVHTANRLILIGWTFPSVQNESIPVPTVISAVTMA